MVFFHKKPLRSNAKISRVGALVFAVFPENAGGPHQRQTKGQGETWTQMFRALKRKNSIDDPLSRPWPPTRTVFRDAFERNLYTQGRLIPCTSVPNGCQPFAHSPDGNKGLCHVSFTGEPYAIERRLYGSGTSYGELPIERWMSPVIEFIRTNKLSQRRGATG